MPTIPHASTARPPCDCDCWPKGPLDPPERPETPLVAVIVALTAKPAADPGDTERSSEPPTLREPWARMRVAIRDA